MKTIISLLFITFTLSLSGLDRATIEKEVEAMFDRCVEIRRDLHRHPELSNREERTSRVIAEHLESLGIPVERGIARHGVVAVIEGGRPGPTVAVRADIDALPIEETIDVPYRSENPGVKHACGHDVHTTVGMTVAELLWRHRSELPGKVIVFFQPAEEGPPPGEKGGAPLMIEDGFLSRHQPEAMFALHTMPTLEVGHVSFAPGPQMASSDTFAIEITGRQSHGAQPHLGIDAIVIGSQIVMALQSIDSRRIDPLEPVVVTIGTFHAGTRFNIVSDSAKLEGTLRTLSPAVRSESRRLIREISEKTAKTFEGDATVTFQDDAANPVLVNDEDLTRFSEKSLKETLGSDRVHIDPPRMIAEDFAHFSEALPSFYYFLGVRNEQKGITANLHTPGFDVDERSLAIGARTMTALVMDYLTSYER
ncbi:MAG: amidohydrolase [Acidobacteria bacterium]|nr:amidohydrolase [Acidobacteriota bacterium]